MTDKIYLTTQKHYKQFTKEVKYWIDFFGLKEFEVTVEHDNLDEPCRAYCRVDICGMIAVIGLQQKWTTQPTENEIERVAFHEVMELLLSPLWVKAEDRFLLDGEITETKHSIIRRLENCLWKADFNKRKRKKK